MVHKVDSEHMMDQIVQRAVLKKINVHVPQTVQLYVTLPMKMVQSLNMMLVQLFHKHVAVERK